MALTMIFRVPRKDGELCIRSEAITMWEYHPLTLGTMWPPEPWLKMAIHSYGAIDLFGDEAVRIHELLEAEHGPPAPAH